MQDPATLSPPINGRHQGVFRICLGLGAALLSIVALRPSLLSARDFRPAFEMTDAVRAQVNTSPFALILGELRVSAGDMLWIKTERYMHRGVGFAPHLNAEEMAHSGESAAATSDAHEADGEHDPMHAKPGAAGLDDEGHPIPLIPAAEKDYRGFIGVIQRNIQPWQSPDAPDKHEQGDELIPWYRVLTLSNPHHVRGYLTGAWWLMKQEPGQRQWFVKPRPGQSGAMDQALAFIDEGIVNNPGAFQLYLMRGRILLAKDCNQEAVDAFRRSAEVALKVRPEGGVERLPDWSYWEEEDFSAAVHYVPTLLATRLNNPAAAREALAWADKLFPGDGRLAAVRKQLGAR